MSNSQKEHVTKYFYENHDNTNIHWLNNKKNLKNLAIDTQEDLNRAIKLTKNPYNLDHSSPVSQISKLRI